MLKVFDIIKANNATFYDYRTKSALRVYPRIVITSLISIVLSFLFSSGSDNFLIGIITSQSILIGFGFNVIFFIGSGQLSMQSQSVFLEKELKQERYNKLTIELFHNINYFILFGVISILLALFLLLLSSGISGMSSFALTLLDSHLSKKYRIIVNIIRIYLPFIYYASFYFFFSESVYTFFRAISRIRFLFEQKTQK